MNVIQEMKLVLSYMIIEEIDGNKGNVDNFIMIIIFGVERGANSPNFGELAPPLLFESN
jgi:hypothetical protein